ncbi:transposase, partial [Corynebacterium belfantii]|uniref:transposase n=1 Tax=Corynebacterium belfantii TaxID=2014537 RepID=UPI0018D2B1C3
GCRGRKDDPLYKHRRALLTRMNYLTQRQKQRLEMLWATDDDYVALEVIWLLYQDMIAAYAHPKKSEGKKLMERIIHTLRKGLPKSLEKLA